MANNTVKIARMPGADAVPLPVTATAGAAGHDLCAWLERDLVLYPGERALIPTGLRFELPPGIEAQIRPRSGLAAKNGLTVLNSPGTIDPDYRGEVKVLLINFGDSPYVIRPGSRIAQVVFARFETPVLVEVGELDSTDRGVGGFGSTGVS